MLGCIADYILKADHVFQVDDVQERSLQVILAAEIAKYTMWKARVFQAHLLSNAYKGRHIP